MGSRLQCCNLGNASESSVEGIEGKIKPIYKVQPFPVQNGLFFHPSEGLPVDAKISCKRHLNRKILYKNRSWEFAVSH
jgi:hypothetical protein